MQENAFQAVHNEHNNNTRENMFRMEECVKYPRKLFFTDPFFFPIFLHILCSESFEYNNVLFIKF